MWAVASQAKESELLRLFEAHTLPYVPFWLDMEMQDLMFSLLSLGEWGMLLWDSCFVGFFFYFFLFVFGPVLSHHSSSEE